MNQETRLAFACAFSVTAACITFLAAAEALKKRMEDAPALGRA